MGPWVDGFSDRQWLLWVMIVMNMYIGLGFVGTDTIGLQLDVTVTGGVDAGSGRLLILLMLMAVSC